jgi:hypothetical protein
MNKDEIERKKAGETISSIYLGNGRIWEAVSKTHEATPEEVRKMEEDPDDLPF